MLLVRILVVSKTSMEANTDMLKLSSASLTVPIAKLLNKHWAKWAQSFTPSSWIKLVCSLTFESSVDSRFTMLTCWIQMTELISKMPSRRWPTSDQYPTSSSSRSTLVVARIYKQRRVNCLLYWKRPAQFKLLAAKVCKSGASIDTLGRCTSWAFCSLSTWHQYLMSNLHLT